jgi:hypothetical protein
MWALFLFGKVNPITNYELKIGVAKRKFDAVNYGRLDIFSSGWLGDRGYLAFPVPVGKVTGVTEAFPLPFALETGDIWHFRFRLPKLRA